MIKEWSVRRIVATTVPVLALLALLEVVGSGYVLEGLKESYIHRPTLLIFLPMMIDLGGDLGSVLASTLSVRLHLGRIDSLRDDAVVTLAIAVQLLSMTLGAFAGAIALAASTVLGYAGVDPVGFMLVATLTGTTMGVIIVTTALAATFLSVRWGADPDDVAIPVVTNICDVAGVLVLSGFILLLL